MLAHDPSLKPYPSSINEDFSKKIIAPWEINIKFVNELQKKDNNKKKLMSTLILIPGIETTLKFVQVFTIIQKNAIHWVGYDRARLLTHLNTKKGGGMNQNRYKLCIFSQTLL
jgi:hypothetical protein